MSAAPHPVPGAAPLRWLIPGVGYAVLFAVGLAAGAGGLSALGRLAVDAFEVVARAHYEIHLATQNVNPDGQSEYAVLLRDEGGYDELVRYAESSGGLPLRRSSLPGWAIVAVAPEAAKATLADLREQPFSRAVLRNRGIWICH